MDSASNLKTETPIIPANIQLEDDCPRYLITLVHGTFARNAKWAQEESDFANRLRESLGAPSLLFSFNWSGKNCHSARLKAGSDLATHLAAISKPYPSSEHIIVGHSHGGNVAMYAIKQLGSPSFKFKIVTMATPFLNVKQRDLSAVFKVMPSVMSCAGVPLLLFLLGALYVFFCDFIESKHPGYIGEGGDLLIFFLGFWVVVVPSVLILLNRIKKFSGRYEGIVQEKGAKIVERIDIKGYNDFESLSVIFSGDEAGLLLKNGQFLSGILFHLYSLLNRLVQLSLKYWLIILGVLFLSIFAFVFTESDVAYFFGAFSIGIIFWSLQGLIVILLLIYPFSLLFKSNPLVFGWESFHHALLLETKVDTRPYHLDNHTLKVYKPPMSRFRSFLLWHSYIYSDLEVRMGIVKWILQDKVMGET